MKLTEKEYDEISNTILNFISTGIIEEDNLKDYDGFIKFYKCRKRDTLIKKLKNICGLIIKRT